MLLETLLNKPENEALKSRLSVAARDVAVSDFSRFAEIIQILRDGQEFAESLAKEICSKGGGGSSGEGDAIEHVILAAYSTQHVNMSDLLKRFQNSREIKEKVTISDMMDLYNNQIGYRLASIAIGRNIKGKDFHIWIKKEVADLAGKGKLSVISNQSNLICHNNRYPNDNYKTIDFRSIACSSVPGDLVIDGIKCLVK
jgi:hypothetical protein